MGLLLMQMAGRFGSIDEKFAYLVLNLKRIPVPGGNNYRGQDSDRINRVDSETN
jgi:hypothetical protein